MGSTKRTLQSFAVITSGDMSGNITSASTDVSYLDNICYVATWTTSDCNGTLVVQGSIDNSTFITFATASAPPAGSNGNYLFDLNQLSFQYVRLLYTHTSGSTGTMNATISGKMV